MSDSVRGLLVRGIAAAKSGDKEEARFYLEWVLRLNPALHQKVDALFWLSEICLDPAKKRAYLEEVLGHQPNHYQARRSLAVLDGRLDPREIVDPDHLPPPPGEEKDVSARRFVCPTCGGRLTYAPDGQRLVCEYCQVRQPLSAEHPDVDGSLDEADFTLALATAKGHSHPVAMRAFECTACGASFILSHETLSLTCPYCAAVYVTEVSLTRRLIPPEAVIPFKLDKRQAQLAMAAALEDGGVHPNNLRVHGVYLPVWAFAISGELGWTAPDPDDRNKPPRTGQDAVLYNRILVPASNHFSGEWRGEYERFDFSGLQPYDPAYLADWPAETYRISLADASLNARLQALDRGRDEVSLRYALDRELLQTDSSGLLVESFQLLLLPFWISRLRRGEKHYPVMVNGQTGRVRGRGPFQSKRSWLSWILGD